MVREKHKREGRPNPPKPRIKLHFLGSAGEVTGSMILVEVFNFWKTTRFLLEVGLHQENESVNRSYRLPKGIRPKDIDFAIISHAHIDHSGYLPKLIADGFRGQVYSHPATRDLLKFLLPDSGRLQTLAADRENQENGLGKDTTGGAKGKRGVKRVYPIYTAEQGRSAVWGIKAIKYDRTYKLTRDIRVQFTDAAHILGAAVVTVTIGKGAAKRVICFTGNVGRDGMPYLKNLAAVAEADYIICESTYGDKLHDKRDRLTVLADIINEGYERAKDRDPETGCGAIVIPAFAVGRVQTVLYDLRELMAAGRIPVMPVFLDSPMAIEATKVHRKHTNLYNAAAQALLKQGIDPFSPPRYTECKKWSESRKLDKALDEPTIIIGSSGMAAGGRILQHLEKRLPSTKNTCIFVGYQGTGVLGHTLVNERPQEVLIHGKLVKVNATIQYMSDYSGHADYEELIKWFRNFRRPPRKLFLVHGDKETLPTFKGHIEKALKWNVIIPEARQCFDLK